MARIRILVVDDDEIERYMILRFFSGIEQDLGLEIEEAESGEEAVARMEATKFDVIMTDFRMGAVSGIDVLVHALKESPSTIRILITGYASPELEKEAVQAAQVHAVLEKPMTSAELNILLKEQVVERFLTPLVRR